MIDQATTSGSVNQNASRANDTDQRQPIADTARYDAYRDFVAKAEMDAEKNFDTLLITLATLALGSNLAILKEVTDAKAIIIIIVAWLALILCVFAALLDRYMSYTTHKAWRLRFDKTFAQAKDATWFEEAVAYDHIRGVQWLPRLKKFAFLSLAVGVLLLMLGIVIESLAYEETSAKNSHAVPVKVEAPQPASKT